MDVASDNARRQSHSKLFLTPILQPSVSLSAAAVLLMYQLELVSTTVRFNCFSCSAVVFFCPWVSTEDSSVGKDKYC